MPRRPFPANPRGPRRRQRPGPLLLALPVLEPEWEFAALTALMKPPRKAPIVRNVTPRQPWTAADAERARDAVKAASGRLGLTLEPEIPGEGDFHLVVRSNGATADEMRAIAAVLSHAFPTHTFKLDRLYIKSGHWLRRRRGIELELGPARDIHLRRELRGHLADLL